MAAVSNRLNIVVDDKLREILAYYRVKYPLLKDVDLIKMAVGGFYARDLLDLPVQNFNSLQDQHLLQALESKNADQPIFEDVDDLVDYLED